MVRQEKRKHDEKAYEGSPAVALECRKQMEANLSGMKQIHDYVGKGVGREMLEALIEEAEAQIAKIKRMLIQLTWWSPATSS